MELSTKKNVVFFDAVAAVFVGLFYGCHQIAVTDMEEGERLYRAKCASCHRLIDPGTRTPDEWHALLDHHGPRLTDTPRSAILNHPAVRARAAVHEDGNFGL